MSNLSIIKLSLILSFFAISASSTVLATDIHTPAPGSYLPSKNTQVLSQIGSNIVFSIQDRTSGTDLPIYEYRGEYWVAGENGHNYSLKLQKNERTPRYLAVMSIDGINIITGQTAAHNQSGYVLSRNTPYIITGWRKNMNEVASFTFAAPAASYAAQTDRPTNVGVIGVALFYERPVTPHAPGLEAGDERAAPAAAKVESSSESGSKKKNASAGVAQDLGTAHGAREASSTRNVPFKRATATPYEVISVRYDSYENLVRRGVLKRLSAAGEQSQTPPTAFPKNNSRQYVPDPPSLR